MGSVSICGNAMMVETDFLQDELKNNPLLNTLFLFAG